MYMKRMLEIGQVENGYVVECRAPIKKAERKKSREVMTEYAGSSEKQFIAKDASEVVRLIKKVMPLLDDTFTSEDEFDEAFDNAAK